MPSQRVVDVPTWQCRKQCPCFSNFVQKMCLLDWLPCIVLMIVLIPCMCVHEMMPESLRKKPCFI